MSHILTVNDLIAGVTHVHISIYNRISKTENSTFERIIRVQRKRRIYFCLE